MLSVVVRFVIKAGHDTSFLERMVQQSVETLRHEPECRQFDVCVDPSDSHRILLYETYTSEAAFGEHLVTSHFRSFDADTRDWVEEKTIERWSKVEPRVSAASEPREPPSPQSGSGGPGGRGE